MPRVFDWNGYRFHFFSNEGDPREPVHIHVTRTGNGEVLDSTAAVGRLQQGLPRQSAFAAHLCYRGPSRRD
jgi:hypothetical protein